MWIISNWHSVCFMTSLHGSQIETLFYGCVHNFWPLWIPISFPSAIFPDLVIFPETCITANKNLGVHKHAVSCGIEVDSTTDGNIQSCLIMSCSDRVSLNNPTVRCFQHLGGFHSQNSLKFVAFLSSNVQGLRNLM